MVLAFQVMGYSYEKSKTAAVKDMCRVWASLALLFLWGAAAMCVRKVW